MAEPKKKTNEEESQNPSQPHELAGLLDTSYPLLQEFRDSCPGSYKHSQTVAGMVEGICTRLEMDVTYMKVAAFYHDIGKMWNPKYFTENQLENEDPHVDLDPWISYQLITRHISDGVNILLNNNDFPRDLIQVISQHHGMSIVKYFASKAKSDNVDQFRYKCTKPRSVEAAVLMIVDHVEATSRSLYQYNKLDPTKVIDDTITDLLDDGQLDDVVIQLGALKKIKEALAKELEGMYQKRVDYDNAGK